MGQSVEQRPGQALGTERLGPFVEGMIRGDENRGALVALRDELERKRTKEASLLIGGSV